MIASTVLAAAAVLAGVSPSVSAMKWKRRVLLVCAADEANPALSQQRRVIAHWRAAAEERDLTVVEIVGDKVIGASDTAKTLRRRYSLPTHAFAVILIGKDGGIKLRRAQAIPAGTLEETIDAMPMRRAEVR
jgi:hypothetical protein